jgi:hypothetical protein
LALLIFLFENELLFVLAFESVPSVSMCMLHSLKSIKHGWLPSALAPCQLHAYYFWVYQVCLTCKLTMSSFEMLHVQTQNDLWIIINLCYLSEPLVLCRNHIFSRWELPNIPVSAACGGQAGCDCRWQPALSLLRVCTNCAASAWWMSRPPLETETGEGNVA